jgi:hypothetical protein
MELTATVRRPSAVCDGTTAVRATEHGLDVVAGLERFDSFPIFNALGDALIIAIREITSKTCASYSVASSFGVPLPAGGPRVNSLTRRLLRASRSGQPGPRGPHHIFLQSFISSLPSEEVCAFYLVPLRRVSSFHWTGVTLS